jgi:MscS family membrane protein
MSTAMGRFGAVCVVLGVLVSGPSGRAQVAPAATPSPLAAPAKDALGRDTPRGTVLGFMNAAREGRDTAAPLYLNTTLRDKAAIELAHQLFVVLDSRLPARLNELSDRVEGSLPNPVKPNLDIVGTVESANGPVDVVVERVNRGGSAPVWLFSRETLTRVPDIYAEIDVVALDRYLPGFLTKTRLLNVRLFEWLVFFVGIPLCYRLVGLLGQLVGWTVTALGLRREVQGRSDLLPGPIRLLLLAAAMRWVVSLFALPLIERQFWTAILTIIVIVAFVWISLMLSERGERYVRRRLRGFGVGEMSALLRLIRRLADVLAIVAGGLVVLRYFGFDPTAALAGLGIGGIAVALAAQKTLENVIGGLSIIFDRAVQVGDSLKLGDTLGTVDYIGLRSTRIRTLDRTILSVPNGQIANANIETLSARDKFRFHHVVGLRYETTAEQMTASVDNIRAYLANHPRVDRSEAVRARFFRLGPFSFDVEVLAYIVTGDWEMFLGTQQEMLLEVMQIVERAGAKIALPSQALQLSDLRIPEPALRSAYPAEPVRRGGPRERAGSA